MPIGKGYVFASDCLEDMMNTKKFINKLKLYQKDWEPADRYIATEPIGTFDLDQEQQLHVNLEDRYQRTYRYVKLVPVGFRKGPINF